VTYYTGTISSGGGTTIITVSGTPGWTTNQWLPNGAPYSVHDVTQNTGSEITANGSNTLTLANGGGPGAWLPSNGDSIQILRATACIDQAGGRGAGMLYPNTNPAPSLPANEASSPTYIWSNSFTMKRTVFDSNDSAVASNTARVIR